MKWHRPKPGVPYWPPTKCRGYSIFLFLIHAASFGKKTKMSRKVLIWHPATILLSRSYQWMNHYEWGLTWKLLCQSVLYLPFLVTILTPQYKFSIWKRMFSDVSSVKKWIVLQFGGISVYIWTQLFWGLHILHKQILACIAQRAELFSGIVT